MTVLARITVAAAPNWENPRIIIPGCSFGPFQGKLGFPFPPTSGALVLACPLDVFSFALTVVVVLLAGFLDEDFLLAFFFAMISSMLTTLLNRVASLVGFPPSFLAWVELFTVISSKRWLYFTSFARPRVSWLAQPVEHLIPHNN